MNYKRGKIGLYLGLVILLIAMLVVLGGCEGSLRVEVIIENQTEQILAIYKDGYKLGDVQPGERISTFGTINTGEWPIMAKNSKEKTVFSETYTHNPDDPYHLQKIETGVYKAVIPPLQANSTNETLPWMEIEGYFHTTDIARAQKEIPFTILLPTYFPDCKQRIIFPTIDGPLSQYQDEYEIEVHINYGLDLGQEVPGIILIIETNGMLSLADPEFNPQFERVEMEDIWVIKTKDDWSLGSDAYYSFNSNDIFYVVETHNLSNKDSNKIVESILNQLK